MPQAPLFHANERIDKIDLDYAALFGRGSLNMMMKKLILDQQDRIIEGFRVELPDQTLYPGRIVVHGGAGLQRGGQLVFTEDQLDITRDIILEGANTTFYIEIEFFESDSDVDARAFWDATVAQSPEPSGDPSPSGQEFYANVATRKTPDWRIVQPISTIGFDRDSNPSSLRIPLLKIKTDASNKITSDPSTNPGMTTHTPRTVILQVVSATLLRVQDPSLLRGGQSLLVGYPLATQETVSISTSGVDWETGLVTLTGGGLVNSHNPGETVIVSGGIPLFIDESLIGRYRRPYESGVYDYRDRMFQGDEIHGDILNKGPTSSVGHTDLNLRSMKDYIDFLASQIEEMKWGSTNPWTAGSTVPPGVAAALPSVPRYYDVAGGIQGSRIATLTVGDGVSSWGDFTGNTQASIQSAISNLPVTGGTIHIKRGSYILSSNLTVSNNVEIVCDVDAQFVCNGGWVVVSSAYSVILRNLRLTMGSSNNGLRYSGAGANPGMFVMDSCKLTNVQMSIEADMDPSTTFVQKCTFFADHSSMASKYLVTHTLSYASSGYWSDCYLCHTSAASIVGACWHTTTKQQMFHQCAFATVNSSCFSGVSLESTSSDVVFSNCQFGDPALSGGTSVPREVYFDSVSNVKFVHCQCRNYATLVHMKLGQYLVVDQCSFASVQANSGIVIENGSDIQITNNLFPNISGDGVSLTKCAIYLSSANSAQITNVKISGNTIRGTDDHMTGIIFWSNNTAGSQPYRDISILNNTFDQCEVGIYFEGSTIKDFRRVNIEGNIFKDDNSNYQKIGIYGITDPTYTDWTISNNKFSNINPNNSTYVDIGSPFRSAIAILGSKSNFNVVENSVMDIGKATTNTDTVKVFLLDGEFDVGKVSRNTIMKAYSGDASNPGIVTCFAMDTLYNVEVSNNTMESVQAGTDYFQGFLLNLVADSSFSKNRMNGCVGLGSGSGYMFRIFNETTGAVYRSLFSQNIMDSSSNEGIFIYFDALEAVGLSINENVSNSTLRGVTVSTASGSDIQVCKNEFVDFTIYGINIITRGSGVNKNVNIEGNILVAATSSNLPLYLDYFEGAAVKGNQITVTANIQNIFFSNGIRFLCCNNICKTAATTANTIEINSGCDFYAINSNVCQGATAGSSIKTVSILGTTGMMHDNLTSSGCNGISHSDNMANNVP